MQFRWAWRPYQERVLASMSTSLSDRRLHVVAAPGSGKTCLGLEVFRRLARPAVVLSPTLTIREQWLLRLRDFLAPDADVPPSWTSRNIDRLGFLTSATYQSLHVHFRAEAPEQNASEGDETPPGDAPDESTLDALARDFVAAGIGTLILDEAHHLRREWWEALARLVAKLDGLVVVSLTATPPYDVVGHEWHRYETLCGPIDEEISVPELVRAGTICPHQDYVWTVAPPPEEVKAVRDFDAAADRAVSTVLQDADIESYCSSHPWVTATEAEADAALEQPEILVSMLSLLAAKRARLPDAPLRILGCRPGELPPFDRHFCQVLLDHYLLDDARGAELRRSLRSDGLISHGHVGLEDSPSLRARLRTTHAKLHGCVGIYRLERDVRGDALRQVVLTDYVAETQMDRLGAWPAFETLRAAVKPDEAETIALLTGRFAMLHESLLDELAESAGHDGVTLRIEPPQSGSRYRRVTSVAGEASSLVGAVTALFSRGRIRLLVSTRALLGEGWDAPGVNSLVLASYVGSYVLSNQMRGRALRTDPAQPNKASSIWHIVAVDPHSRSGFFDLDELERRFETFVGLAADGSVIESGIARLALPRPVDESTRLRVNQLSAERLERSADLGERWRNAVEAHRDGRVVPSVATDKQPPMRRLLFFGTLKYAIFAAAGTGLVTAARLAATQLRSASPSELPKVMIVIGAIAVVAAAPGLLRSALLWARSLPVDGSLRLIGLAMREALAETGLIEGEGGVVTTEVSPGVWSIRLAGGDHLAGARFAEAMEEVLGPIENPRYLVSRGGFRWRGSRLGVHAVPRALGDNKDRAIVFHRCWRRHLGPTELIYTRSEEGRRALLRARARSFTGVMQPGVRRLNRWQ